MSHPGPGRPPRVPSETIRYIRTSKRKAASLALQLGLSESYIHKVRQGTRRREESRCA